MEPCDMSKTIAICLFAAAFSAFGEETVRLAPTAEDATPAVLAALDRVRAAGGGVLEFAPGDYHFRAETATPMKLFVSNHDQSETNRVQLPLVNLKDVELRGRGARFVFHGATIGLVVRETERVKVVGLSLDWNRPFLTEATVLGFQDGGTLVSVDAARYPYAVRDGGFVACGDDWEAEPGNLMAFDGREHALVEGSRDIGWKGAVVRTCGEGRFLMKSDLSKQGVRKGDLLSLRPRGRPCPAVFVEGAKDTVLEDVVIRTAWGMGVICQRSENFTWRGTRRAADRTSGVFASAGSGRFLTLNADASHFSNVKGLVRVENCHFEGMMDDAVNVHSTCLSIEEKCAPDKIRCRFMHFQAYGFEIFRPGETLRYIRGRTLENGAETRVVSVERRSPHEVVLKLAEPVPADIGVGDAVENADYQPAVDFIGNVVARNRARGALFTTPRPVRVIGNLFERVSGSAILFAGDAQGWYESGACEDVAVRNNVFRDCLTSRFQFCDGILSFYPMVKDLAAQKKCYHRNIVVENNVFETFDVPLVHAISTENLRFRNNVIRYDDAFKGWGKGPFVLKGCSGVRTDEGNRFSGTGEDKR